MQHIWLKKKKTWGTALEFFSHRLWSFAPTLELHKHLLRNYNPQEWEVFGELRIPSEKLEPQFCLKSARCEKSEQSRGLLLVNWTKCGFRKRYLIEMHQLPKKLKIIQKLNSNKSVKLKMFDLSWTGTLKPKLQILTNLARTQAQYITFQQLSRNSLSIVALHPGFHGLGMWMTKIVNEIRNKSTDPIFCTDQ